jgi:hypothetical protein
VPDRAIGNARAEPAAVGRLEDNRRADDGRT